MAGSTFGSIFSLTSFGESHGKAIGGIIEGCPAGLKIDPAFIQAELDKRKPGQSRITTSRKESDEVQFLSGMLDLTTTGNPIGFLIPNQDQREKDYAHLKDQFRPSHADFTYQKKYGLRDHRGGGRASARETACRVVAGGIAKTILAGFDITVQAYVSQVGSIKLSTPYNQLDLSKTFDNIVHCPDPHIAGFMEKKILQVKNEGDTIGGIISAVIKNVPPGLGEPVFDKLHADLAKAMMSINAVKGFEYGSGFDSAGMKGSEHNDLFEQKGENTITKTNFSGGIQGGISNGEDIYFRVAFKPVATLMKDQDSVDSKGNKVSVSGKGRHDPCVVPRAVVIVEAMTAMVIADHLLRNRTSKL